MAETRKLDPKNDHDKKSFFELVDIYLEFERTSPRRVYHFDYIQKFGEWAKHSFEHCNQNDFLVTGRYTDDVLDQFLISYNIKLAFGLSHNTFPYWCLSQMYFREKTWGYPRESITQLSDIAIEHFENQGFKKMFTIVKAPKKVQTAADIEEYLTVNVLKTFAPADRYTVNIEEIFFNQEQIENYGFSAIRAIVPKMIVRPIILISWNMKPNVIVEKINDQL